MSADETLSLVRGAFDRAAREIYVESVTMAEHLLHTGGAAQRAGAEEPLVVAALLHDIGHFLEEADDEQGLHDHAEVGADFLAARFPLAVSEPVRLHIAAKRYLCGVEAGYIDELSPAARRTLDHQGGVMSIREAQAFAALPYADDAIRLRRWEDRSAENADLHPTPSLSEFEAAIVALHL